MGNFYKNEDSEFIEKTVKIGRVTKVVKGGRTFSFNSLVVVGDKNGRVGYGFGKAKEVPAAIQKALNQAKKNLVEVPLKKTGENKENVTIPHEIVVKYKSSKVMLKPAAPGTGVIASGPVRTVMEACGINNILTKSIGSNNPINLVKATIKALTMLMNDEEVSKRRGIPKKELFK